MVYIRVKNINSKPYAYVVENKSTVAGPRQKVLQYLGRVHRLEGIQGNNSNNLHQTAGITANSKSDFLQKLVSLHLENYGFNREKKKYHFQDIIFEDDDFTVMKKNKDAVLALNEGYLCSFTLQRLLQFKKSRNLDQDAYLLAKYFLEAGLPLSQEQFVQFYQLS